MGCCLGTTNHLPPPPEPSKLNPKPPPPPPPPAFEEETVKEVLSETPIVPKPPPPPPSPPSPPPAATLLRPETPAAVDSTKTLTEEITENDSEMFSYSESFSAATTATVADKMDEDGEVNQKVKHSPPPAKRVLRKRPAGSSGEVAGRKDRAVRPARRQNIPSPEKKNQFPARSTAAANGQSRRNVGPASDFRREASGRRSRSPAVRGEVGQRRRVREGSPAGKTGEVVAPAAKVVESEGKVTAETVEDGGASPEMQTSESLENPLVSLECFIFL